MLIAKHPIKTTKCHKTHIIGKKIIIIYFTIHSLKIRSQTQYINGKRVSGIFV